MTYPTTQRLRELISAPNPPCVSIYQATHRHFPENQRDPLVFKNLLRRVEDSLSEQYRARDIRLLTGPLRRLLEDTFFWSHTLDGLAVLADGNHFDVFRLHRTVSELGIVADTFHVKPLLRYLQSADRFQVLCLTRGRARLLEGDRYLVAPIEAEGFPMSIDEALGEEVTEPHLTVAGYGGGVGAPPMHHGHGSRKEDLKLDTGRFFRVVDREVLERFTKPSGLPLILAALAEHHAIFREVSRNAQLASFGVEGDPDSFSDDQIREQAWSGLLPAYRSRLGRLVDQFHSSFARQLASGDLSDAARAAVSGRVATLLVDADRTIPGKIDANEGAIEHGTIQDPETGDMLDDLAEIVLRRGGEVVVVPSPEMPTTSGLAAVFRY